MHVEDSKAALDVRKVDRHAAVEAARPGEGGIECVGAIGRGEHNNAGVAIKAVHLSEDLVKCLLTLVVAAAAHAATATARTCATDGIDFVDENDARSVLLRLAEEVAHTRGADTNEHLNELRARGGHEGHAGLTGNSTCEQRLARAGRALHDGALGDLCAKGRILCGLLEEIDNLRQLELGAVAARHIHKRDTCLWFHLDLRLRLAHATGARHPTHAAAGTAT
mmetsp:Transcript_36609/g.72947  ORF Transcript_36609/g.72947 Transcript_36609/m.72947 type:complete len:223 (+) Transcript_36609:1214-1882(+)